MSDADKIIEEVKDYLRYRTECGELKTDLEPETVVALVNAAKGVRSASTSPAVSMPAASPRPQPSTPTPQPSTVQPQSSTPASPASSDSLQAIAAECAACRSCGLCQGRIQVVPGQGNANHPDIMFIGEAPGADEDQQGLAFVGRAGQLLTKMIAAMGYAREEVFIANICKCRPPNNRTPLPEEMAACIPFLKRQIALVKPRYIIALGNTALLGLLGTPGITRLHGQWRQFEGIPLMPTYHPAYLLRLPAAKRDCWNDLQLVMRELGKPLPQTRS